MNVLKLNVRGLMQPLRNKRRTKAVTVLLCLTLRTLRVHVISRLCLHLNTIFVFDYYYFPPTDDGVFVVSSGDVLDIKPSRVF